MFQHGCPTLAAFLFFRLGWGRSLRAAVSLPFARVLASHGLDQPPILRAQRRAFQQIRPVLQRLPQLLLAPPAPDLRVIAVHQHLRRAQSAKTPPAACNADSRATLPLRAAIAEPLPHPLRSPRPPRQSSQTRLKPRCPARRESAAWSRPPPPPPPARRRSARNRRSKAPCRSRAR